MSWRLFDWGGRRVVAALLCAALCACSSEGEESDAPQPPPGPPEPCAAGETTLDDGSCQAAGIPDGSCAPGFASDGAGGCVAVLPAEPCPDGMIALPGDEACREIAPCGDGTWGDVAVDGNTQHVDASFSGTSTGSAQAPWVTIQEGINAAAAGATVAVAAGQYNEFLALSGKAVVLWGRCPSMVSVVAPAIEIGVRLFANSHGSVVRGIAISGGRAGVETNVARDVVIEQVWIHDVGGEGVVTRDTMGESLVTVRDVLIERALGEGLYLAGSTIIAENVAIRSGADSPNGGSGIAVWAQDGPASGRRANLTMRNAVLDRNRDLGLFLGGVDAALEGVLVRDTQMVNGISGRGIEIRDNPATNNRSNVTLSGVVLERNHTEGLIIVGSDLVMDTSVIRDSYPRADGWLGRGLSLEPDPGNPSEAGVVLLRQSVVERNHDQGIFVSHGSMTVEASVVRDTIPQVVDGLFGRGISARNGDEGPATLAVRTSRIERNVGIGILLATSSTVESTVVSDTVARTTDGALGDGIVLIPHLGVTDAVVTGSLVHSNARAGVATFDSNLSLQANTFECNQIHLNAEEFQQPYSVKDLGDNVCGCAGETVTCQILSASLLPPEATDVPVP